MPTASDPKSTIFEGRHFVGRVIRRFLVSYPVAPELLAPWLSEDIELSLRHGVAWVSASFANIAHLRPSFLPESCGIECNYLIHRTRASVPFPDGQRHEISLILEANINRALVAWWASRVCGVRFRSRDIQFHETLAGWHVKMSHAGDVLYEIRIERSSLTPEPQPDSLFDSLLEADAFLLGVGHAGEWKIESGELRAMPQAHEKRKVKLATCDTRRHVFLEHLTGHRMPIADHVLTYAKVPHYFGGEGVDLLLPPDDDMVEDVEIDVGVDGRRLDPRLAAQLAEVPAPAPGPAYPQRFDLR